MLDLPLKEWMAWINGRKKETMKEVTWPLSARRDVKR